MHHVNEKAEALRAKIREQNELHKEFIKKIEKYIASGQLADDHTGTYEAGDTKIVVGELINVFVLGRFVVRFHRNGRQMFWPDGDAAKYYRPKVVGELMDLVFNYKEPE